MGLTFPVSRPQAVRDLLDQAGMDDRSLCRSRWRTSVAKSHLEPHSDEEAAPVENAAAEIDVYAYRPSIRPARLVGARGVMI